MADARPCSSGDRAPDSGSGCRPFESGQGHFGAVAQWQGVPSATGRSRVRTPPAPRHAACRRVQAQTFRGTTSRQDGAPPRWNTQTAASRRPRARRRGRPARPRAGPCGCGAAAARLLPKQETAGSNPVIRSIREHWFSMYSIPRFRAGGPGEARTPGAGRQYAPYAPLVQRSEQRTFNPRATGPNPVGGTTSGRRPGVSAPIYQRIGCGNFFRPGAKQGGSHAGTAFQGRAYDPSSHGGMPCHAFAAQWQSDGLKHRGCRFDSGRRHETVHLINESFHGSDRTIASETRR